MKSNALKDDQSGAGQIDQAIQLTLTHYPHRNQQLFSDHYLNVILPGREDWRMLGIEAEQVLYDLQKIYAGYTTSEKEAQTEDDLVKPILKRLGHSFEVQASLETPDGTKVPDYIFYRDQQAVVSSKGTRLWGAR